MLDLHAAYANCENLILFVCLRKVIYKDRWSVGQVSPSTKQMIGGYQQFAYNSESSQRLTELLLLAGLVLNFWPLLFLPRRLVSGIASQNVR